MQEGVLRPKPKIKFEQGDKVQVTDGPFTNFTGVVDEVKAGPGPGAGHDQRLRAADAGGAGVYAVREDLRVVSSQRSVASKDLDCECFLTQLIAES